MKNKKHFFLLFAVLLLISFFYYGHSKKNTKGTYLKYISKNTFFKKNKNPPLWAYRQVAADFNSINEISQSSIDETYGNIKNSGFSQSKTFFRYRIINNALFRYFSDNEQAFERLDFEKAIITLCEIAKLPDLDFIYCDLDGLPLENLDENFFKTVFCPVLCHAKLKDFNNLILIPDHNSLSKNWKIQFDSILKENKKISWELKINKGFWRGGTNDRRYTEENFYGGPRIIISKLSKKYCGLIDAGITRSWSFQMEDLLKKEDLIKNHETIQKHLEYKYLPVLDGVMCTYPGFQWRLLSNCVCFKQNSNQIQWFYSALRPYEHYVPIENDLSDLIEKIIWARNNDGKCRSISKNARDFALSNLTLEDIYVYLYMVLKQYSLRYESDKNFLLKDTLKSGKWICIKNKIKKQEDK